MEITYLKHANIDKEKWDRCIDNAHNGLIYAYSFYLDSISKNWDALVLNDYEIVMPLTWNKKLGISYLRQPPFTQQLGIFGRSIIENNITEVFINKALERFSFIEINLNYANNYKHATAIKRNLILPLNKPFAELEKSFRKDFVKNVKNNQLIYEPSDEVEKAIELFKQNYSERIYTPEKSYENLLQLYILLKNKRPAFYKKSNLPEGKLACYRDLLKRQQKDLLHHVCHIARRPQSRSQLFFIIQLIKEFSEQDLVFDFEGSEIPSINSFFKKFGAIEQPYPFVRINHLPRWTKWIKNKYDDRKSSA